MQEALPYSVRFFNLALYYMEKFTKNKHLFWIASFLVVWTETLVISTKRKEEEEEMSLILFCQDCILGMRRVQISVSLTCREFCFLKNNFL